VEILCSARMSRTERFSVSSVAGASFVWSAESWMERLNCSFLNIVGLFKRSRSVGRKRRRHAGALDVRHPEAVLDVELAVADPWATEGDSGGLGCRSTKDILKHLIKR
jgi:hypothetical protein